MLGNLRPYLTKILNPIAKRLNVNPNILTLISPLFAILSAILFAKHYLLGAGIVILLNGLFDVLDGAVARYHNKTSDFGAFLDSTMDRFSDGIIIIGIVFGGYCDWLIGVLLVHSALTISYVRARAESKGIQCEVGIAERAVRLIILVIGSCIGSYYGNKYFLYILIALLIASYITVFQRVYHVYKVTEEEKYRFKKRPMALSKKDNNKQRNSTIDLDRLDEMDEEDKKIREEEEKSESTKSNIRSFLSSKVNRSNKDSSIDYEGGLKDQDNTKLKRDKKSQGEFEPLFDEEELNGSLLNKDYDGVEDDPIIIDEKTLSDEPFDLSTPPEDFSDMENRTQTKKIIRRKKRKD